MDAEPSIYAALMALMMQGRIVALRETPGHGPGPFYIRSRRGGDQADYTRSDAQHGTGGITPMPIVVPVDAFVSERAPPAGSGPSLASAEPPQPNAASLTRGARSIGANMYWTSLATGPATVSVSRGKRVPSPAYVAWLNLLVESAKRVPVTAPVEVFNPEVQIDIRGIGDRPAPELQPAARLALDRLARHRR